MRTGEIVKCDHCARDLTYTGLVDEWLICVESEKMDHKPGVALGEPIVHNPLPYDLHFCNMKCLISWAKGPWEGAR